MLGGFPCISRWNDAPNISTFAAAERPNTKEFRASRGSRGGGV